MDSGGNVFRVRRYGRCVYRPAPTSQDGRTHRGVRRGENVRQELVSDSRRTFGRASPASSRVERNRNRERRRPSPPEFRATCATAIGAGLWVADVSHSCRLPLTRPRIETAERFYLLTLPFVEAGRTTVTDPHPSLGRRDRRRHRLGATLRTRFRRYAVVRFHVLEQRNFVASANRASRSLLRSLRRPR